MNSEDRCFCDLAPLYAFDLLNDNDRQWVEQQLIECPDLAEELSDFQTAVAAIPYSAPLVPMAANLKDRLFQRLELPVPSGEVTDSPVEQATEAPDLWQESIEQSNRRSVLSRLQERFRSFFNTDPRSPSNPPNVIRRSQSLRWFPFRVPGVRVAPLHINLLKGEVTALVQAEAGVHYPTHSHAEFEEIYMLEGDLRIGEEVFYAGDYIRSEFSSIHAPTTEGGCMFYVRTSLWDDYSRELADLVDRP